MSKVKLNVNVESDVKERANQVFKKLGMDFTTGITIYLNQVISRQAIPFDLSVSHYTPDEIFGKDWRDEVATIKDEWE